MKVAAPLVCSACGAALPSEKSNGLVRCPYCKTEHSIRDEAPPGAEQEPSAKLEAKMIRGADGELRPQMIRGRDGTLQPEVVVRLHPSAPAADPETERKLALAATQRRLQNLTSSDWGISLALAIFFGIVGGIPGVALGAATTWPVPAVYGALAGAVFLFTLVACRVRHARVRASHAYRDEVASVQARIAALSQASGS